MSKKVAKMGRPQPNSDKRGMYALLPELLIYSTNATVDFNSPLAGHTLDFEIKVVAVYK